MARFDIDVKAALTAQLLSAFGQLTSSSLSQDEVSSLENEPGVYELFHNGALVYVGKTEGSLRKRLTEHVVKIGGRRNISLEEMTSRPST